jgi:hypothetical protein
MGFSSVVIPPRAPAPRADSGRVPSHVVGAIRQVVFDLPSIEAAKEWADFGRQCFDSSRIVVGNVADGAGPRRSIGDGQHPTVAVAVVRIVRVEDLLVDDHRRTGLAGGHHFVGVRQVVVLILEPFIYHLIDCDQDDALVGFAKYSSFSAVKNSARDVQSSSSRAKPCFSRHDAAKISVVRALISCLMKPQSNYWESGDRTNWEMTLKPSNGWSICLWAKNGKQGCPSVYCSTRLC